MLFNDPLAELLGKWACEPGLPCVLFRIALALVLSAIIGWERSSKRHAAGMRTFMLVTLASAVTMLLDITVAGSEGRPLFLLSAATVIAVALIGTNSILYSSRSQIKGLTTAFAVWSCTLLGFLAGGGMYSFALTLFAAMLCSLYFFPSIELYLKNRSNHFEVHLELKDAAYLQSFVATIRELGMKIDDIELNQAYMRSGLSVYSVAISIGSEELKKYKTHGEIIEALSSLEYIYHIEEMN